MKIGNGFGFKMVQSVFYTIAALLFLTLGIFYTVKSSDILSALKPYANRETGVFLYIDGYYSDGEYIDVFNGSSGGDSYYKIVYENDGGINLTMWETKKQEIIVNKSYAFAKYDKSAKRMIFSGEEGTVEVSYSDVSYAYEWETYYEMSIAFLILGCIFSVVTVLQFISAFKGKKSIGANVLGIVVNMPFSLFAFGLCGLIGCVKGRMYLQFQKAGYALCAQDAQTSAETASVAGANQMELSSAPVLGEGRAEEKEEREEYAADSAEGGETQKTKIKKSEFRLDLYDASIDEKTWKDFKKSATQEELAVIALGAKYRVAHTRIQNAIYALGIVLSIALLWPTNFYSLIAYPVFAFLATKTIRYEDTLSQAYRKLDKDYKALVDGYFNCGIGWTILDLVIKLGVFYLTLPYQAILLFIGLFAPNFVISKNGILVSIPKGYDVGDLGAVGEYYAGFSFIDETAENSRKYEGTVTVDGYEISVHSADGKNYYDGNGNAYVKEGGKLVKK